jgi:Mn2+/Fe2+ NRAMP family transporter
VLGAAGLVVALVLAGSFHRVEHVLLALSAVPASYLLAGVLAQPDWSQAARGLVVPSMPLTTDGFIAVTAKFGTTLAPWGLAFIQSYAVDKGISPRDYGPERVEVVTGSLLTGIIGIFIVVACAATLARAGLHIEDARDAAQRSNRLPATTQVCFSESDSLEPRYLLRRSFHWPRPTHWPKLLAR